MIFFIIKIFLKYYQPFDEKNHQRAKKFLYHLIKENIFFISVYKSDKSLLKVKKNSKSKSRCPAGPKNVPSKLAVARANGTAIV